MRLHSINTEDRLSLLWIFILFNVIFRDIHEFLAHGFLEELMQTQIGEVPVLIFGIALEIPIMMVLLSKILAPTINKWTNIIAAAITSLGVVYTMSNGDLDDVFFGSMQCLGLILIVWQASRINRKQHKNILSEVLPANT